MKKAVPKSLRTFVKCMSTLALSLMVLFGPSAVVRADEADAKRILKAMSDYMAAQKSISFDFDATLDFVTTDDQKLALASSGTLALNRPDKIHVSRAGGFADIEMFFDGKTLTLLGESFNTYTQLEVVGTIEHLVDELRETYNRPLPAADLLLTNSYDELMLDVVDIKDLGSGVVGGVECDCGWHPCHGPEVIDPTTNGILICLCGIALIPSIVITCPAHLSAFRGHENGPIKRSRFFPPRRID